jgi:hypothetical protein
MLLCASNSKKKIHLSNFSRQGLALPRLLEIDRDPLVTLGAYCLMPNHFHLLIRSTNSKDIPNFLQRVATGYSMYFNKKYERSGALFQGKFKSKRIDDDRYFKRVLNYIHANPVELFEPRFKEGIIRNRTKLNKTLEAYEFSSLPAYLGSSGINELITMEEVLPILEKALTVEDIIEEALVFADLERQGLALPEGN